MKCEYCDNPVPSGSTHCPSCGATVICEQKLVSSEIEKRQIVDSGNQGGFECPPDREVCHVRTTQKMRVVYVLLGFFFGAIGLHNFYAGYNRRAIAQMVISLLSFGLLAFLSWIWAIVEIIMINEDCNGRPFV